MSVLNPDMHDRRKYNILLVGEVGAGKSSLVNSFTTIAGNERETQQPATARTSLGSTVTRSVSGCDGGMQGGGGVCGGGRVGAGKSSLVNSFTTIASNEREKQ